MATHETVVVQTGQAANAADLDTEVGTVTGVTKDGGLGFDGTNGGVTDRPMMGIAGLAVTIDDATYVDPADGSVGSNDAVIHTNHYPNSDSRYANEAP